MVASNNALLVLLHAAVMISLSVDVHSKTASQPPRRAPEMKVHHMTGTDRYAASTDDRR